MRFGITATYYREPDKSEMLTEHYLLDRDSEIKARRFVIDDARARGFTVWNLSVERLQDPSKE